MALVTFKGKEYPDIHHGLIFIAGFDEVCNRYCMVEFRNRCRLVVFNVCPWRGNYYIMSCIGFI